MLFRAYVIAVITLLISVAPSFSKSLTEIDEHISSNSPQSGLYILERGEESLLGRAWLVDHAMKSIEVQYFIWSVDNVGILAAEALLRAAERGVKVRVIIDDLLMDATPESMVALAAHPNISVKIYNPVHKTGVSLPLRIFHLITDFRNFNQRMHDKTLIVDGKFLVTGGRNMADEYYDYDHHYNFRDRDVLVVGGIVPEVQKHFDNFWESPLSKSVEKLLPSEKLLKNQKKIQEIYDGLHSYADDPLNYAPPVRGALAKLSENVPLIINDLEWGNARFLHDSPGKNAEDKGLGGGSESTHELAEFLRTAQKKVIIQSPYLVLPDGALELFQGLVAKGVEVKISTNSLSSTDNLAAFSGYKKQRESILSVGVQVYEFKPNPKIQTDLIERYPEFEKNAPIFAIHAKTMVVDGEKLFVGTFNLDPRSANLNTEVGVLIESEALAQKVEARIEKDMLPENSWNAKEYNADKHADFSKKLRLWGWQMLSIDALL